MKFLKLTDFWGTDKELVEVGEIARVQPYYDEIEEEVPCKRKVGFFNKREVDDIKTVVSVKAGSEIILKNEDCTYVAETPEQIYAMINGV